MEQIGRLSFLTLDGDAPAELALDPLPAAAAVCSISKAAFTPFFTETADIEILPGSGRPTPPATGLQLIYVYGHAWLTDRGPQSAVKSDGQTVPVSASDLFVQLLTPETASRTILILDCCHAAAFDPFLTAPVIPPRLLIYACAAEEKAIALPGDGATRLSLGLAHKLYGRAPQVDLIGIIIDLAKNLDRDQVIRGQNVTYRMNGRTLRLGRAGTTRSKQRERTVGRVRNMLLVLGATVAAIVIAAGWFYWSHVLIEIDLANLQTVAARVSLVATDENPATNNSQIFAQQTVSGNSVRFWAPAGDVILRIEATYADGAERRLGFHLDLKPGFEFSTKSPHLALPPASAVLSHPGMAYVPATTWYHGREREPRQSEKPYWIDIRPPTVDEYRPIVEGLLRAGHLQRDNSFLLTSEPRSAAVDAVGLSQLRTLNKDLGAIFGTIDQDTSAHVSAPGDIVVGLAQMPCPTCPAPMTRYEAELYCSSQHKRLPNDLEWELAVRGVDGRVYPWGNEFDQKRANVPGLPQKGDPPPALKPVDAYKNELSPFGLIDTVGNAGDWVTNETGSYERVYMGADLSVQS